MRHLVLADDSLTIQKVVELTFIDQDVEVHSFSDGPSALSYIRNGPVDVLLVDASLPVMDGYELCRQVKEIPSSSGIPIILLVGMFDTLDENRAREAGFEAQLTKPFETSHLLEVVTVCLERERETVPSWPGEKADGPEQAPADEEGWPQSDVGKETAPDVGAQGAFGRESFPVPEASEERSSAGSNWVFSLPVAAPSQRPVFHLNTSQCASSPLRLEREIQLQPTSPHFPGDERAVDSSVPSLQEPVVEAQNLSDAEMERLIGLVLQRLPSELRRLIPPLIKEIRSSQQN